MAEKKASLTVLGGALAGTRFVLEDAGPELLLGTDPSCQFRLDLPGVSESHARLRIEASGVTIEDAGSDQGLHVNDSRVEGPTPLHNGDIVWLGTPGEPDVVMLQCILPPGFAPRPAEPAAPRVPDEDETLALALEQSEAAVVRTEILPAPGPEATPFAAGAPASEPEHLFAQEPSLMPEEPNVIPEEPHVISAEAVPFAVDGTPTELMAEEHAPFVEPHEHAFVMGEDEPPAPTVIVAPETEVGSYGVPEGFGDVDFSPSQGAEPAASIAVSPEFEPTIALASNPPPPIEPAPAEPIPRPSPPAAPARPAPAAPRPPRAAAKTSAAPARSRPAPSPRPPAAPRFAAEQGAKSPLGFYLGLGLGALAVIGGGVFAARRFLAKPSAPRVAEVQPSPATSLPPVTPSTTPAVVDAPPEPRPAPVVAPPPIALSTPAPAPVATPPPPTTTLKAVAPAPPPAPVTAPTPSPAAAKAAPTPVPTPVGPSPEQLRAQQVATLLGQAESAIGGGQLDAAISALDQVLQLDPGNPQATTARATAVAQRDASRKKFVAGRTVVKTEKAQGGITGFEGADVQRTPDFSGRIEFEMSPATGLKPGDGYTMKFYLVNDGKKPIRVGGVTATTSVNGSGAGGPVANAAKEVAPQQRALLGQLTGSWQDGTTSWSADVLVTANKGDSLKNTLTWR